MTSPWHRRRPVAGFWPSLANLWAFDDGRAQARGQGHGYSIIQNSLGPKRRTSAPGHSGAWRPPPPRAGPLPRRPPSAPPPRRSWPAHPAGRQGPASQGQTRGASFSRFPQRYSSPDAHTRWLQERCKQPLAIRCRRHDLTVEHVLPSYRAQGLRAVTLMMAWRLRAFSRSAWALMSSINCCSRAMASPSSSASLPVLRHKITKCIT